MWVAKSKSGSTALAEFATSQPQASYAAFTFGLRHRWTYFMRTLPDIEECEGGIFSTLLIPINLLISTTQSCSSCLINMPPKCLVPLHSVHMRRGTALSCATRSVKNIAMSAPTDHQDSRYIDRFTEINVGSTLHYWMDPRLGIIDIKSSLLTSDNSSA